MAWGSQSSRIYGMEMAERLLTVEETTGPKMLVNDQPTPWPSGSLLNEGPFQYRHGGYIYLFYSRGNCCPGPNHPIEDVYRVEVCRSPSASFPSFSYVDKSNTSCTGNTDFGTLVLASNEDGSIWAPGSVGVLDDDVEGRVLYYQYHVKNTTSDAIGPFRFGFSYLEFDESGWPVVVSEGNRSGTIGNGGNQTGTAGASGATETKKSEGVAVDEMLGGAVISGVLIVLMSSIL